jgi:transcriptional regulator with XRE-family HTH domain
MLTPGQRLEIFRNRAGKSEEETAQYLGIYSSNYYDLERFDDDMGAVMTLEYLEQLGSFLKFRPVELFTDVPVKPMNTGELVEYLEKHLKNTQMSMEEFEQRVGFTSLGNCLSDSRVIRTWCLDCLRYFCEELNIDWLRIVASLKVIDI